MPRRRRRSTWGCVTRLSADRWRLRWMQDGQRRTEVVHGTRRQADDRLAQLRVECGSEPESRVTLGQAYERWWLPDEESRVAAGDLAPGTRAQHLGTWRIYVGPRWGESVVRAIRPLDVQEWLSGLSRQTAVRCRSLMRQIIEWCVRYEIVETNVASVPYRMPTAQRDGDRGAWDVDGLRDAWSSVRGSLIEAPFLLAAFGSCRVGESLGVRAGEVSLVDTPFGPVAVVPVARQVSHADGSVTERLKNPQSRRSVVVPGPMGERLAELDRLAVARGDEWLCDDGTGSPTTQRTLQLAWGEAMRSCRERHPFRNLRNSWQTCARWVLRMPQPMIERLMGHSGSTVTDRHYDRPADGMLAEAVAEAYASHPFADGWDEVRGS